MLNEFLSDLRFGARKLVRSPGFTVVAVVILALGIGANAAVFSFIDALLIKSLPVADPDRLIVFGPGGSGSVGRSDMPQANMFSYAQLEGIEKRKDVFSQVAASPTSMSSVSVGRRDQGGNSGRAACQLVSGEYFDMFGIRPFAGRWISPQDDRQTDGGRVVVLGYQYWLRHLDGDPGAVGQELVLQDQPFQIIGIAPDSFRGHFVDQPADIWTPLSTQPIMMRRNSMLVGSNRTMMYWLDILGRLAPGVTLEQAEASVNVEIGRVHEAGGGGELRNYHLILTPAGRGLSALRTSLSGPLTLLYGGTSLLLLIVCANLANLLLARASDRRGELGLRLALGAGRGRLVRQLLAESVILATTGAVLGLAIASWLMPVISAMIAEMRGPNLLDATLNRRVIAATAVVGASTILLFGLAPVLWATRNTRSPGQSVPRGSADASPRQSVTKHVLVVCQVSLSLVLLTCAGLLFRTLGELRAADLGMRIQNVYSLGVNPRVAGMTVESQEVMRAAAIEQVAAIPGVASAAFAQWLPFSGSYRSAATVIPGYETAPNGNMNLIYNLVSPSYFDVLEVPLISGRLFDESDLHDGACIVSEAFARRFFPQKSPIGETIQENDQPPLPIIGVVGDTKLANLRDEPPPVIYQTTTGYEGYLGALLFRTDFGNPSIIGPQVQRALRGVAPEMPVEPSPTRMASFVDRSATVESLLSELTAVFAGLALLLAALGVYGLFSYAVRQRSGEFGVRQALGANRGDIVRLVMRQASFLLAAGVAVGLIAALFVTRILSGILYGVSPTDPRTFSLSFAVLTAAGLIAAYAPARRAASVNPADLLRRE
jgi:predicted permease